MTNELEKQFLKSLVKIDKVVEKCVNVMKDDKAWLLQHFHVDTKVWFIPYTTDTPQLRKGIIKNDFRNNEKFIAYSFDICDDGNWFVGTIENLKITDDELYLINKKLASITTPSTHTI